MEKILSRFFESVPKVKVLKLFFRNSGQYFSIEDIEKYTRLNKKQIAREIQKLLAIGIVEKKTKIPISENNKGQKKLRKITVFCVNQSFELYHELKMLFMKLPTASDKKLTESIKRLGRVKLAIISGFFINNPHSRVDILIVGDALHRRKISNFLSRLEHETGKALSYSIMNFDEFKYRMSMFDRFLRDILEFPHQKLINKIHI